MQREETQEEKVTVKAINNLAFNYFMLDTNLDKEQAIIEWQSLDELERDKYMEAAFIDFATMEDEDRAKWM